MLQIKYNKDKQDFEAVGNIDCELNPITFTKENNTPKKSITFHWCPKIVQDFPQEKGEHLEEIFRLTILKQLNEFLIAMNKK